VTIYPTGQLGGWAPDSAGIAERPSKFCDVR
jgi:hypothetical protein